MRDHEIREYFRYLSHLMKRLIIMSETLQAKIDMLTADVAAENAVIDSAVVLISGFSQRLADAIAAATAAGATPEMLQALTALGDTITAKQTELANAVAANTPVG